MLALVVVMATLNGLEKNTDLVDSRSISVSSLCRTLARVSDHDIVPFKDKG